MKKLIFLLFLIPHFLHAQANIAGLLYASNFAGWSVPQGNQGLMSWTSPSFCTVTSGGATFRAFAVGVPVTLNDAEVPSNTEVITPIQANYSGFGCSISATTTHPHKSFYFTTATAGLGEALSFAGSAKYQIVLTPDWTRLGGQTSMVTGSTIGNTNVTIMDQRTAPGLAPYTWSGSAYVAGSFNGGGSGSQKVIYTSKLSGVTGGVAVVPGSSASGTIDSATAINAAIAGGNVDLEVDSGYALSASLVLSSNTTIHCVAPQYGFIMQVASNADVMINAHQNVPTTASGTGGFLPSNIVDQNIRVSGCILNGNSTQAVTGSSFAGIPHTVNPATNLFVLAVQFSAVQNFNFDHNEVYDSGCWAVFFSNSLNIHVDSNYIHQPLPLVAQKSTDGVHFIGPDQFLWVTNNHINSGDDAVAFNADDGNRAGSGDPNLPQAQFPGVLGTTGPITDAVEDNTTLDGNASGGRLLSATELIDRVTISNLKGTTDQDYIYDVSNQYPSLGAGNIGSVTFDNFDVHNTTGANPGPFCGEILITASYRLLQFRGIKSQNPPSGVQALLCQQSGTGGILSLRDWDVYTQSTHFPTVVSLTGGTVAQVSASGINWDDSGSGTFFSGSVVPNTITVSNYSGPGPNNTRLLASGFAPTNENGDAFTNTYTSITVPTAIHKWPMNEGTGTTLHDTIGSTNLTTTNVTWATASGLGSSAVANFDGTNASANASGVDSTLNFNGTQPMSVGYWANVNVDNSGTVVGNLETASSYQGWEVGNSGTNGSAAPNLLVVGAVTTNQMTALGGTAAGTGAGKCFVFTYTGSLSLAGVKIYINGTSQSLTDTSGTLTSGSTSTSALYVGARNNSTSFYNGALGYMSVWNVVLTPAQAAAFCALGPV